MSRGLDLYGRRKNGSEVPVEIGLSPTQTENGIRVTVIVHDITERNAAENRIRRNLERIRAVHDIDMAITSTLELPRVLELLMEKIELALPRLSASTVRLMNRKTNQMELVACRNINASEWKGFERTIGFGAPGNVLESKMPLIIENIQTDPRVQNRDFFHRQGLVSYLGIPLAAKGNMLGVLGFFTRQEHDFSTEEMEFLSTLAGQAAIAIENAQFYEQTKIQAADLKKAVKVKNEFLSVMSHELRTPLNVAIGYAGMLKDRMLGDLKPQQEDAVRKILTRSKDQLDMINNILLATAFESTGTSVHREVVAVPELLNQLMSTYSDLSVNKGVDFTWDCATDLPMLEIDRSKLMQIFQNLIDNAVKFTDKGMIKLSARQIPETRIIEFKVSDTGIGIPPEHLSLIFEKFHQADSSETRSYGGVGLGLYIAKRFTELLGGQITAESELGKGSTFTVTLPVSPA